MLTEGGFVEGENKKLGLFAGYVDIFRGIPFAAPPKPLEDPQPHPGWNGKIQLLNAFGLGFYFRIFLFSLLVISQRCFHLLGSAKKERSVQGGCESLCLNVSKQLP